MLFFAALHLPRVGRHARHRDGLHQARERAPRRSCTVIGFVLLACFVMVGRSILWGR